MCDNAQCQLKDVTLGKIKDFVEVERTKHTNKARGGQMASDSHSPRMAPSLLMEFEKMLTGVNSKYTYEYYLKLEDEIVRLKNKIKEYMDRI